MEVKRRAGLTFVKIIRAKPAPFRTNVEQLWVVKRYTGPLNR
jgi:hypothetical protein